jgi:hypothetical protein
MQTQSVFCGIGTEYFGHCKKNFSTGHISRGNCVELITDSGNCILNPNKSSPINNNGGPGSITGQGKWDFFLSILIPPVAPHSLIIQSSTPYSLDTDNVVKQQTKKRELKNIILALTNYNFLIRSLVT